MTSRYELESRPHYVYLHRNTDGDVVYVGRTNDPKRRPHDVDGRDWMRTEQTTVEIQGPMPYAEACRVEADLIDQLEPEHNHFPGWEQPTKTTEFVDAAMRQGVTRKNAVYFELLIDAMPPEKSKQVKAHHIAVASGTAKPISVVEGMAKMCDVMDSA